MRIKRVEIIGFKSFCDRAVVNIGAEITAVVGPNGCGKSNIVDAIRWCMGEQSAKHLRGKAMEDVIFAGSETRGPAPMAEVSLTFDDVGFSHETLQMAMTSDTAEAERIVEEIAPPETLEAPEPDPDGATDQEAVEAVQAVDATAHAEAPSGEASSEVAQFLADADAPPKLDFARYTEVTITRRLYRDGSSHYLINKTPCRLRDVTDFFLGTGVGTKAYSIIEQGRIGQIVSARPQDRRSIIEEAAGITKFKSKKKAAERKLEQTKQNLLRVSDIVVELDKRMGTLRRQAQKAERYRKYRAELKDIELWKASHRFLELAGEEKLAADRLGVASAELGDLRAAESVKDAAAVAERAELAIEERRLAALSEQIYELDNRVRLAESKIEFQGREADELDERVAAATAEAQELAQRRDEAAARLQIEEQELASLEADVAREAADVQSREAAVGEARAQLANAQARLDEARAQLAVARTEVAKCDAQRESLVRRREETERRLARVVDEVGVAAERAKEIEREARRVDGVLAELRQTRLDLGAEEQGFEARRELLADQVHEGEAQVETLRTEAHRRRSRLQSLIEIQDRYEGFARGTRAVMQKSDELGRIRGLVADVVRAPEQLEVAVEAALGDRLGGVLVEDQTTGVDAISFLKSSGAGRSAFVPVMQASGGPAIEVDDRTELVAAHAAIGGDGVLGRMTDLVEFADGYDQVGKNLLHDYVVVDSIQRAVAMHEAGTKHTLVTLDGDIVDGAGVIAGGSRDAQGSGVLSQKREIRELEEITEGLERDLTEATARLVTAKQELKQVEKAIQGLKAQAHESDLQLMGHDKDAARLHAEIERMRGRMGELGRDRLELEERLAAVTNEETEVASRRAQNEDRIDTLEKDQLGMIEGVTGGREQLDELGAALTEARVRAAQLGEKRASLEASALRLMQTEQDLATRIAKLGEERASGVERAETLRADSSQLAAELGGVKDERTTKQLDLEGGRSGYEQRLMALTAIELEVRDFRSRADKLAHEVTQLEIKLDHCRTQRAVVCDAMLERYQVEVAKILTDYHLRAPAGATEDERATELKDLIERMGTDINLTAIEEFQEVSTRFEFLSTQKADLEHAVDQLEKAIHKINSTSRKLFKDTFHAVNNTFKEVFPRLFRGGQAFLSLSTSPGGGEVDMLEAGVEIMAQPPGKKNATVEQLSGGEKALTAVALVFSIFLIKPSPFCILDEVDAPLDEANVDRYNEIVREMTDRSQFIVITHNKRTMESADNLYGVTMQEPGVSKLVAVNLKKLGSAVA
ncbi:MAG TPA: chromosome segregation protein SMC [Kofleriaceae bacterium]|nr:chromosome segregation protein SMC [Kofleriaceae bacterium]